MQCCLESTTEWWYMQCCQKSTIEWWYTQGCQKKQWCYHDFSDVAVPENLFLHFLAIFPFFGEGVQGDKHNGWSGKLLKLLTHVS